MDGAILFSDILMLPYALGQKLAFHEGEGPVLERIEDPAGVARLDSFSFSASRLGTLLSRKAVKTT
jgi:uroporphyrinogen-III decarboxylase